METALEQFKDTRNIVSRINEFNIIHTPSLGLKNFKALNFKSEGMSGDILARGELSLNDRDIGVVVKFFKVPSSYKTFTYGDKIIRKSKEANDKNKYEIGNTMLLTDKILMNNKYLTHHLTFAFKSGVCTYGYQTELNNSFLVPIDCDQQFGIYPQCAFRTDYNNNQLDDTVRYLIVERTHGDLEQWILLHIKESELTIEEFDNQLLSVSNIMLITTLQH